MSRCYENPVPSTSSYNGDDPKEGDEAPKMENEEVKPDKSNQDNNNNNNNGNKNFTYPEGAMVPYETTVVNVADDEEDYEVKYIEMLLIRSIIFSEDLPEDLPDKITEMIKENEREHALKHCCYFVPNKKPKKH